MKFKIHFIFRFAAGLLIYCASQCSANIPSYELSALNDLFIGTNGDFWDWSGFGNPWNFTGDPDPCADLWQGITCTTFENETYVQNINLNSYNLVGTLSDSIGNFSFLSRLTLDTNHISGTLPVGMCNLNTIYSISINFNFLDGTLPAELGKMSTLSWLLLQDNYLVGTIPPELGRLSALERLRMNNNYLSGSIPAELGSLLSLQGIVLNDNLLNGTISPAFGQLASMMVLILYNNQLTGPIPDTLGGCTQLLALELHVNMLSETIPASLGRLPLQYLTLNDNQLRGTLPDSLGNVTTLYELKLQNNFLSGSLPVSLGRLTNLHVLSLSNNGLNGSIPDEIYNLKRMQDLLLDSNGFSGSLTSNISHMASLNNLVLTNNYLTGTVPPAITQLTHLSELMLDFNLFEGSLPTGLSNIYALQYFSASDNQLVGEIPAELGLLFLMQELNLRDNRLTGPIPPSLSRSLNVLSLENNMLTGPIPANVTQMTFLVYLELAGNRLTGRIPDGLQRLSALVVLSLNDNLLSGPLSSQASQLASLELLFLFNNMLSGTLDGAFDGAMQKSLLYIDVSNNEFSGTIPASPFQIQSLRSFSAVSNCLYGALPAEQICALANMTSLVMDGMQSASVCQYLFFPDVPFIYPAYGIWREVSGGVPSCLFNMPRLETLHLSGNGITGSLSSDVQVSASLNDLSLSHNNLGGNIPEAIQMHPWTNLDLSFNKMNGVLSSSFPRPASNSSVSMEVNRLSGNIPSALVSAQSINMLDGNLFQCNDARSDLPRHDQGADIYECGSNSFNYSLFGWIGLSALTAASFAWFYYTAGKETMNGPLDRFARRIVDKFLLWLAVFDVSEDEMRSSELRLTVHDRSNIIAFGEFVAAIRRVNLILTVAVVVVLVPTYILLTEWYNTYSHEYAWTMSATYLCSLTPTVTLFLIYAALSALCVGVLLRYIQQSKKGIIIRHLSTFPRILYVSFATVVLVNVVLVTAVNIAYVYIQYEFDSEIVHVTQFALAIFKLLWNNLAVRELLRLTKRFERYREDSAEGGTDFRMSMHTQASSKASQQHRIGVEVLMILFNNLGAPFLATALVSSNCFYNIIAAPPEVDVSYHYLSCISSTMSVNGSVCIAYDSQQVRSTSYMPPFIYSYQCSSTFITTYATIYVIMFVIAAFLSPLTMYALRLAHKYTAESSWLHRLVVLSMPKILRPAANLDSTPRTSEINRGPPNQQVTVHNDDNVFLVFLSEEEDVVFHCDLCVVKIINLFAMLVTFGAVLPPLAVVGCMAVFSFTYYTQLSIGRFLAKLDGPNRSRYTEILNRDCEHAADMFMSAVWIVVPFASIFYALLLLDTLGDDVGWRAALWAPVLTLTLPVGIWLLVKTVRFAYRRRYGGLSYTSRPGIKKDSFFAEFYQPVRLSETSNSLGKPLLDKL